MNSSSTHPTPARQSRPAERAPNTTTYGNMQHESVPWCSEADRQDLLNDLHTHPPPPTAPSQPQAAVQPGDRPTLPVLHGEAVDTFCLQGGHGPLPQFTTMQGQDALPLIAAANQTSMVRILEDSLLHSSTRVYVLDMADLDACSEHTAPALDLTGQPFIILGSTEVEAVFMPGALTATLHPRLISTMLEDLCFIYTSGWHLHPRPATDPHLCGSVAPPGPPAAWPPYILRCRPSVCMPLCALVVCRHACAASPFGKNQQHALSCHASTLTSTPNPCCLPWLPRCHACRRLHFQPGGHHLLSTHCHDGLPNESRRPLRTRAPPPTPGGGDSNR
jgi:hypothetical protein